MPRIRDNKVRTIQDAAEEIIKRYGLNELPDEMKEMDPVALPIERDYALGEGNPVQSFLSRHPEYRRPKKEIVKDASPEIAPGTRAKSFIEKTILPQVDTISKSAESLVQRLDDLESKASECSNPACRQYGKLHLHQNQGA